MNQLIAFSAACFLTISLAGCDTAKPTNSMENVDAQKLAEYEKAIAAEANMMSEDTADSDAGE